MPSRSVTLGVVGGVLVGIGLTAAVLASGHLDRPTAVEGDEAIAEFLEAWRDHREGTYVVEGTFERESDEGTRLESEVFVAQRPPDRVAVRLSSVDATVDGRPQRCVQGEDAPGAEGLWCAPDEEGPDAAEQLGDELRTWLGYLVGERPFYEVSGDGEGCFDLERIRDLPLQPYGDHARFCFDDETGAMTLARIERPGVTEQMEATSVRSEVTDADLLLPAEQP